MIWYIEFTKFGDPIYCIWQWTANQRDRINWNYWLWRKHFDYRMKNKKKNEKRIQMWFPIKAIEGVFSRKKNGSNNMLSTERFQGAKKKRILFNFFAPNTNMQPSVVCRFLHNRPLLIDKSDGFYLHCV